MTNTASDPVPPARVTSQILQNQFKASNPNHSAWVSANAGSGKTYVLVRRVVRLLLSGVKPSKILCLTYTNAGAANMSVRVFDLLAQWTQLDDEALIEQLHDSGVEHASPKVLRRARKLFTRALETPGGLKIQTIHSFAKGLLHQFTLEAGRQGDFELLDDIAKNQLIENAKTKIWLKSENDKTLNQAMHQVQQYLSETQVLEAIQTLVGDRREFFDWLSGSTVSDKIDELAEFLDCDIRSGEDEFYQNLLTQLALDEEYLRAVLDIAKTLSGNEISRVISLLEVYFNADTPKQRLSLRMDLYLKSDGGLRKSKPGVKALHEVLIDGGQGLEMEYQQVEATIDKIAARKALLASQGLFTLAKAMLDEYRALKYYNGVADYDDIIHDTADLLSRSNVQAWVHYKLDQGIEHVLVDEAQDTSPLQWQIISALTQEFYTGQSSNTQPRTVFGVGDHKQSIFSFQGAQPQLFATQRDQYAVLESSLGNHLAQVRLPASFRSTRDVLAAIDLVFSNPANAQGLGEEFPPHEPVRTSDAGEVDIWPIIQPPEKKEHNQWYSPVDMPAENDPAIELAQKIADQIRWWLDNNVHNKGTGKPIKCGDILILVRKRDRFHTAITRALKQNNVAVAGSDRVSLNKHIAIQDLLAMASWGLMRDDDLTLAAILKNPLFNMDEDTLFSLCHNRQSSLWDVLVGQASADHPKLCQWVHDLERIQTAATQNSPFEFFYTILVEMNGRDRFKQRLGDEVDEVLDAFLDQAKNFETQAEDSLCAFVHHVKSNELDIKREFDNESDEVRIMTVHSAKGLEAPIVFLVDQGNAPYSSNHAPKIIKLPIEQGRPAFLWQGGKAMKIRASEPLFAQHKAAALEEYQRLLYVAMTRAADKLILCGYASARAFKDKTWYGMVAESLLPDAVQVERGPDTEAIFRWIQPHALRKERAPEEKDKSDQPHAIDIPGWATSSLNDKEDKDGFTTPLHPSVLGEGAALALNHDHDRDEAQGQQGQQDQFALQRGILVHKLLQIFAGQALNAPGEVMKEWLATHEPQLAGDHRNAIANEVEGVLTTPELAFIFKAVGQSEVGVAGDLKLENETRSVSGKIDRLFEWEDEIWVIDYKTDRIPASTIQDIKPQYVMQMAVYHKLICEIYPDKPVRCALLWTKSRQLLDLDPSILQQGLNQNMSVY